MKKKPKVTYWIAINEFQEVFRTHTFDKEELQRIFDECAHKLKPGDYLEYGKVDEKYYNPFMLYVKCSEHGLFRQTPKGHWVPYYPKH